MAAANLSGKLEPSDPESGASANPDSGKPVLPVPDSEPEPVSKDCDQNSNTLDQELVQENSSS